jgi:hypothetical protein
MTRYVDRLFVGMTRLYEIMDLRLMFEWFYVTLSSDEMRDVLHGKKFGRDSNGAFWALGTLILR